MSLESCLEAARTHPDQDRRCQALHELGSLWRAQPEAVQALYEQAYHDEYWRARAISLQLLSGICQQSESVCGLATDRICSDPDSRVRSTAVEGPPAGLDIQ